MLSLYFFEARRRQLRSRHIISNFRFPRFFSFPSSIKKPPPLGKEILFLSSPLSFFPISEKVIDRRACLRACVRACARKKEKKREEKELPSTKQHVKMMDFQSRLQVPCTDSDDCSTVWGAPANSRRTEGLIRRWESSFKSPAGIRSEAGLCLKRCFFLFLSRVKKLSFHQGSTHPERPPKLFLDFLFLSLYEHLSSASLSLSLSLSEHLSFSSLKATVQKRKGITRQWC